MKTIKENKYFEVGTDEDGIVTWEKASNFIRKKDVLGLIDEEERLFHCKLCKKILKARINGG